MSRTKPKTAADLLAARAAHLRDGVEDLENERVGVDDVDVPAVDIDGLRLVIAGLAAGSGFDFNGRRLRRS